MLTHRKKYVRGGGLGCLSLLLLYWLTPSDDEKLPATQLVPQYKYPHDYRYLVNPGSRVCGDQSVQLLILVSSALPHKQSRQAIRRTWGSPEQRKTYGVKVVFLLGRLSGSLDRQLEDDLERETRAYGDIVREDYLDTYNNLTIKTIGGIKWATTYCPQADYVMKTDDDIYVNLSQLGAFLAGRSNSPRSIYGCVKNGPQGAPQPVNSPGIPFKSVHPLFTAGAGYVLSSDLVPRLNNVAQNIKIIRVEDAFLTGYCARRIDGVNKVHSDLFSCGQLVDRNCDMKRKITGHKITPQRMLDIHSDLRHSCLT